QERIDMLGKPAPAIDASDVDGDRVRTEDLKGKVVLVDFCAMWAPPCVAAIPQYAALRQQYKDKDFAVVSVDLDLMREGLNAADPGRVRQALRDFLVEQKVGWPVVLNGRGDDDIARRFGVTEVPANFLIGRDGKVLRVELYGAELDKAV